MLVVGIIFAGFIGISLGMLGGGGSILTVPILVYLLGLPTHEAIATSLLVVGVTSVFALVPHARGGRVEWKTGALFGATSMAGAYGAGRLAHLVSPAALLVAFGAMMLVASVAMMRGRRPLTDGAAGAAASDESPHPTVGALEGTRLVGLGAQGLLVGVLTGFVGAGGGFVIVPALVLLAGLPMRHAVGTSLLVIATNSFVAFAGHASAVEIDVPLAAAVTAAAVAGSFIGVRLAGRVPQDLLRRGFGWFVLVMASFMLVQEVPTVFGAPVEFETHWPWIAIAVALPLVASILDLTRELRAKSRRATGESTAGRAVLGRRREERTRA